MAKVLLIDDEPSVLELFKYMFLEDGHEVAVARNGREALDVLAEFVPDFMVVDVSMPVMSGAEFILEFSGLGAGDARYYALPFVVMTGENFMDPGLNARFARTPGFVCFFPKMTPPEMVIARMREVLRL